MRYYPVDPKGNLDEWGAVIKRREETYQREMGEQKVAKVNNAAAYAQDLDRAINEKNQRNGVDKEGRAQEREHMLSAVQQK